MRTGIDAIGVYVSQPTVSLEEIARNPAKAIATTGNVSFKMPDRDEDSITMAANALDDLMLNSDLTTDKITRIQVATETQVDLAKPIGASLHELFGLRSDCDVRGDLQYACLSGDLAVEDAVRWVRERKERQAVVITTDIA